MSIPSIVAVNEIDGGMGLADDITRTYYRVFRVETNSPTVGQIAVRNAAGLPKLYDYYAFGNESDKLAFCIDVDVKREGDSPFLWLCTYKYSSRQDKPQSQQNTNPLLRAPDVAWQGAEYSRPFAQDLTGAPVVNSSMESFDPSPETEDSRPVLVISRNELAYDAGRALAYKNAINSDVFYGAPPRCAQMKFIPGVQEFENGIVYWKVTYEIHFRRETFLRQILDQGFRDLNGNLFRDQKDMLALSNPTLLDGGGYPLYIHQRQTRNSVPFDATKVGKSPYILSADITAKSTSFFWTYNSAGNVQITTDGYKTGLPTNYDVATNLAILYQLKIGTEIVSAVSFSTNPFRANVIIRGQGGTAAQAWPAGTPVIMMPVYLQFREFKELPFSVWGL